WGLRGGGAPQSGKSREVPRPASPRGGYRAVTPPPNRPTRLGGSGAVGIGFSSPPVRVSGTPPPLDIKNAKDVCCGYRTSSRRSRKATVKITKKNGDFPRRWQILNR